MNGSERRNSFQFCGVNDGSNGGISPGSPSGAEAADDLTMDNGWTQVTLTDVVGRTDIAAMQENKQAVAVFEIPFQESFGFALFQRAFEQPVANALDPLNLSLELWW